MKGQSEVTEVIFLIGIVLLLFILIFSYGKMWRELLESLVSTSPKIVVRDIAGLVSISGAAPDSIKISYEVPTDQYSYYLEIKDRAVKVRLLDKNKVILEEDSSQTVVDPTASIYDKVSFIIQKKMIEGKNVYEVKS